ncbi:M16 family metallopeptidase [Gemmatimonadota bacterium]
MKKRRLIRSVLPLLALLVLAGPLADAGAQELSLTNQVIERTLDNGLTVLMVVRPETPLIRCILAYRVGAVNERPGITGMSHFHEHMMFKGSYSMGVKPGMLERDQEIMAEIDEVMAMIVEEESKITGRDDAQIIEWKARVSELINQQREETMLSEELWGAYQEAGGTGINASTGQELTQYYVTLPKNKIELYLALEADRMVNPVFREFYSERDVIAEERRMSENRPGYFFNEQLNATFYAASPYSWSVVGWMSDVTNITRQEMQEYRDLYYRPDNAVLVMAGDIDVDAVMALVEQHFGAIPARGKSPRVRTREPSPEFYRETVGPDFDAPYIEKRVFGRAATNPSVQLLFHIPPLWHQDLAALYILGQVMSSRSGDMYQTMVLDREHATGVGARASTSMYDGSFRVSASVKEVGRRAVASSQVIEDELWSFLEAAKTQPVDAELLQRVKNQVEASFLLSLRGTGIASSLVRMEVAHEWQFIEEQYRQRMAVTAEDLMAVAQKYFTRDNSVTGVLERER